MLNSCKTDLTLKALTLFPFFLFYMDFWPSMVGPIVVTSTLRAEISRVMDGDIRSPSSQDGGLVFVMSCSLVAMFNASHVRFMNPGLT